MVEFVSNRMLYIKLNGRWCDIVVLNMQAPTEDKDDDIKDRFYEELEQISDQSPRYHMKILLGDLNANVGREDIFKPINGNQNLLEASNDNEVSKFCNLEKCNSHEHNISIPRHL
jgi:hypothetical protein